MLRSFRRYLGLEGPAALARPNCKGGLAVEALEDRWMPSTGSPWANLGAGIIVPPAAVAPTTPAPAAPTPTTPPTITPPAANSTPVAIAAPTPAPTATPAPAPAVAAPQTLEVDATFAQDATNSEQTQSVSQFNPALGTLTGVQIVQQSTLTSQIRAENLGAQAATVGGTVQGTLNLNVGGVMLTSRPGLQESAQVGAYDGAADASDSVNFGPQSALDTRSEMLSPSSTDLSAFVGTGTLSLSECAAATASIKGPGNVAGQANTTAGACVRIIYYYTPFASSTPTTSGGSGCSGMTTPTPTPPTTTPPTTPPTTTPPATAGSLSGFVYLDNNNNGVMDSGDGGISGVTITLQGGGTSKTATTDINGAYAFSSLPAGSYTITETPPMGFQQGTNNVGSAGGTVSGDVFSLALASGQVGANYNFGEVLTAPAPSTPTPNTTTTPPPTTSGNTCTPPTPPPAPSTPPPAPTPPPTSTCTPPPTTNVTPPPAPTPPPTMNTPPTTNCTPPPPDTCTPPPPPVTPPPPPPTPSTPPPIPLAPPPVPLTPPAAPTPPPPPPAPPPPPPPTVDPVLSKRMFLGNAWESL
jgi:hypothetical protein